MRDDNAALLSHEAVADSGLGQNVLWAGRVGWPSALDSETPSHHAGRPRACATNQSSATGQVTVDHSALGQPRAQSPHQRHQLRFRGCALIRDDVERFGKRR